MIGQPPGARLKSLVELGDSPVDCWKWLGHINKQTGYGKKQWHGRTELAHRWVWEMFFGKIPSDMVIDHKCGNRECVNPHHLEVVTQAENCRRGRGTKLDATAVSKIKEAGKGRRWGDGARLARKYGVSGALIHDIWNGRAWRDET